MLLFFYPCCLLATQGLQLWADLQVLMGPFDAIARRRPERHFPALAEASVLLSLEKASLWPRAGEGRLASLQQQLFPREVVFVGRRLGRSPDR